MKISNKDLQRLYKEYVLVSFPSPRKYCPSFKKIANSFNSKSSEKQKTKILNHITTCHYCCQEFKFILQILRNEKKINKNADTLRLSKKEIASLEKRAAVILYDLKKREKSFFPILSWKYGSLLLAAIAISIILIIFIKTDLFRFMESHKQRGETISQIKLILPIRERYSKNSLFFKWSEFIGSDYYIIELFDETLALLWKSDKIYNNYYVPHKELTENLTENRTYFWIVKAYLINGEKVESPLAEFFLVDE